MGGTFVTASGRKVTVSDQEFRTVHTRYAAIYLFPAWGPSLKWGPDIGIVEPKDRMSLEMAVWVHMATVASAEDAGYRVGDQELAEGIRTIVTRAQAVLTRRRPEQSGLAFTPALYDRVLQMTGYRQPKADFERTVREILLKDKDLTPLLDSLRFSEDRASAYEQWKAGRERVHERGRPRGLGTDAAHAHGQLALRDRVDQRPVPLGVAAEAPCVVAAVEWLCGPADHVAE
jgi:hypothetical protein